MCTCVVCCSLEEGGQTALGPALLVAIMMASKVRASKVVMCTDGLANVGLGNLDTDSADQHSEASSFYSQLGEKAKEIGFVRSLHSVRKANEYRSAEIWSLHVVYCSIGAS